MVSSDRINVWTHLEYPEKPYSFERRGQTVFFSSKTFVGIRVNRSGRAVLEAMEQGDTPSLLADRLARKYKVSARKVLSRLLPFLQTLVDNGYLWLAGSSEPTSTDCYDTDFHPSQMYLHITHACNQSCVYCYNAQYRQYVKGSELSFFEVVKILKEGAELGVQEVIFTGGEPLMRREVFEIANYGQKLGLRVCLLTNGTLITKRGADRVAKVFDSIFVSLDSCHETLHDLLRGFGSYQKTVEGIRELCAMAPEKVCLRPVITCHNVDSLAEFPVWVADELGCSAILPVLYLPNSLAELKQLNLLPDMKKFKYAIASFEAASKRVGIIDILSCLPFRSYSKCGAGSQILSVDATGEVFPCQALHFPELSAGNLRREKLEKVGSAPSMQHFAEISIHSISKCQNCEIGPVCGGGCRALAYVLGRDIYAYNEFFCSVLRENAENRLWAESEKNRRD